jgi:DNA-binding LacI/PurR family transcriptional regulator
MSLTKVLSKSEHLCEEIKYDLVKNNFKLGTKYHSISKIVDQFNVAHGTARKALQGLVDEGNLRPIKGVGYIVESLPTIDDMQKPATGPVKKVVCCVLHHKLIHSETYKVVSRIQNECDQANLRLEICLDTSPGLELLTKNDNVAGFIVSHSVSLANLRGTDKPIISLGQWPNPQDNVISLTADTAGIADSMFRYLHEMLGHNRIGIFAADSGEWRPTDVYINEIVDNFKINYSKYGLTWDDSLLKIDLGTDHKQYINSFFRTFNEHKITALLVLEWPTVAVFLQESIKHGIKIPEDLSIVTVGNSHIANLLPIKMTRFEQYLENHAKKAFELITSDTESPFVSKKKSIYFPVDLVVGESSFKAKIR